MQPTARTWVAATAVLALLLAIAAWFLLVNPVRADAASVRAEAADTQARNDQLVERTTVLRRQFADLPDQQATLDELAEALPADVALPTLIRTVDGFASTTGVTVMSLTPGAATAVVDPAAAATTAAPAPAPTGDASAAPAPTDGSPTPAPGTSAAPAGPTTMATPVTITVIGDFFDAQAFLRKLQAEMPRAFLVRDLSVTAEDPQDAGGGRPATTAGDVTMTVTADVFSRPSDPDASAAAPAAPTAPATPGPTPGATPAPGSAPSTPAPAPASGAGAVVPPVDRGTTS